jgi:hypothetical protein
VQEEKEEEEKEEVLIGTGQPSTQLLLFLCRPTEGRRPMNC